MRYIGIYNEKYAQERHIAWIIADTKNEADAKFKNYLANKKVNIVDLEDYYVIPLTFDYLETI